MNLSAALRWRYATKKFDPDKVVPEAMIDAIVDAANLSATSYGLQPFQFVIIRNRELQQKLIASSYGQKQVADASHVIVIATRTDVDKKYIREYYEMVEEHRGLDRGTLSEYADTVSKTIGKMSDVDRMEWAAKQAYIALGTLLAACAAFELDSCPMEGFVPQEYNDLLGLGDKHLHAAVVLPVGYRADDDPEQHQAKVRRPLPDMIIRL